MKPNRTKATAISVKTTLFVLSSSLLILLSSLQGVIEVEGYGSPSHPRRANKPNLSSSSCSVGNGRLLVPTRRQQQDNFKNKAKSALAAAAIILTSNLFFWTIPNRIGDNNAAYAYSYSNNHDSSITTSTTTSSITTHSQLQPKRQLPPTRSGSNLQSETNYFSGQSLLQEALSSSMTLSTLSGTAIGGNTAGKTTTIMTGEGLSPPTEQRPQITFQGSGLPTPVMGNQNQRQQQQRQLGKDNSIKTPILQGLVYILEPNSEKQSSQLSPTDTLVITASSASDPTHPIAGAKYPLLRRGYGTAFPLEFRLYGENLLRGMTLDDWVREIIRTKQNVVVTAQICPQEYGDELPCTREQSALYARGVSRAIDNLPGMKGGDVVWTAASLPLQ